MSDFGRLFVCVYARVCTACYIYSVSVVVLVVFFGCFEVQSKANVR